MEPSQKALETEGLNLYLVLGKKSRSTHVQHRGPRTEMRASMGRGQPTAHQLDYGQMNCGPRTNRTHNWLLLLAEGFEQWVPWANQKQCFGRESRKGEELVKEGGASPGVSGAWVICFGASCHP